MTNETEWPVVTPDTDPLDAYEAGIKVGLALAQTHAASGKSAAMLYGERVA